jgi:hypothetical protein
MIHCFSTLNSDFLHQIPPPFGWAFFSVVCAISRVHDALHFTG